MKNKKIIGLLLSLAMVLGVAMPGTLAVSAETESAAESSVGTSAPNEQTSETPLDDVNIDNSSATDSGEGNCGCNLFEQLMACATIEEMDAIFASTEEARLEAMTDEQWAQIDAHYCEIEPEPAPAIIIEVSDPPVASEIYSETVNFDNVAPFVGDVG